VSLLSIVQLYHTNGCLKTKSSPQFVNRVIFDEYYKWWSSLLRSLLWYSVNSLALASNILIGTLFPMILCLWSSRTIREQFSRLLKTIGMIIFWILTVMSLHSTREFWRFWTGRSETSQEFNLFLISLWNQSWFLTVFLKAEEELKFSLQYPLQLV